MAEERFRVVYADTLPEEQLKDLFWHDMDKAGYTQVLIDSVDGRVVYVDSDDCLEDKYLFRDLRVFVYEMNKLAQEAGGS